MRDMARNLFLADRSAEGDNGESEETASFA